MVFHCIHHFSSVTQSCPTLPLLGLQPAGSPVLLHLPEFDCMCVPHNLLTCSLLMGTGVVSNLWLLKLKQQQIFLYKALCRHLLSFFFFFFFFGETYTFISGVIPLTDCKIKARGPRSVQGKVYKGAPSPLIMRIWKQI